MDYITKRELKYKQYIPQPITEGKGVINSIIDNLPVPLHLPGYNYAGPGTPLDLHLERGVKPINKLDEAAMKHDIAYSKEKSLEKRHEADYKLQEEAWKRFKADDASIGEKANAWLVTTAMRTKRAIGAGVSKTAYTEYPANLDAVDIEKLKKAVKSKTGTRIVFRYNRTKETAGNELRIPLKKQQILFVKKAHSKGKDAVVRMTAKQIADVATKEGGFLPALLAAAPLVTAVGSLITNGVNAYNNKKANDKLVAERIRHNKAMESSKGDGLYILKKPATGNGAPPKGKGKGLYILKKPATGNGARPKGDGLYILKKPTTGNGLYHELVKKKKSL